MTEQKVVRLVWGYGQKKVRMGDNVRYRINGNEYEGKAIAFPINGINPQKYAPITRDIGEMTTRCVVDIVPIENITAGLHQILDLRKKN